MIRVCFWQIKFNSLLDLIKSVKSLNRSRITHIAGEKKAPASLSRKTEENPTSHPMTKYKKSCSVKRSRNSLEIARSQSKKLGQD